MIKTLQHHYLVDWKDNNLNCLRFIISNSGINCASTLQPWFGIVFIDIYRSVVTMYYKKLVTCKICICMSTYLHISFDYFETFVGTKPRHKIKYFCQHNSYLLPLFTALGVSWVPCTCHLMPGKLPWDFLCFSPCWLGRSLSLFLLNFLLLELKVNHDLSLQSRKSGFCTRLPCIGFDVLFFTQFSHLYLLLFEHRIPNYLGIERIGQC